ncbi:MAG TPA: PAS domain-containing protein [Gemmatimonadales bacterium]|nr:PAS domain-containing protein [Gemmatimonadales bacterium]
MPDRLTRPGVLDVLVDAAIIVSSELRVIAANAAARSLLLDGGTDPTGMELLACVVPDDAPRLIDALDYARRGTRGYAGLHVRLQTAAGEPVHTELRVAALGQRQRSDTYLLTTPNSSPRRPGPAAPGGDFYALLARNAADTPGVRHVLIGRLEGSPAIRVSTLAIWSAGHPRENLSYEIEGGPCAETLRSGLTLYPARVQELFPEHPLLQELSAESYAGAAVHDAEDRLLGVVALLGDGSGRPAELAEQARLLASRTGAEMERERLAMDARQTEKRWLELVRGTPDGLFDIRLGGGGPGYLSRRCLELLGYSRPCAAWLEATTPLEWVHPEDRSRLEAQIGRALQEGHHLQAAVRLRRRGGDHRWFDVHARLTRETSPGPIRALGFISETDPRQASTGMLRRISEVARVAAWTYDVHTDDLVLLTDGTGTTGVPDEEIVTLVRKPESLLGPDETSCIRNALHHAGAGGAGWDFVYSRRLPQGTTVWRRTFAHVDVERGAAARVHGGVQDITQLRDLEATYLSARKMEAMTLLAGGIAHDFANLVTGLEAFRESIALSLREDDPCQADLGQMGDMLRSAAGLSRQLLALARRQVLEPTVVSLDEVLTEMRPLLQRMIGETVTVDIEPGGGVWPVLAVRSQLEQVVLNLTLNARDAMPHGGRLTFRTRNAVFHAPLAVVSGERPAAPLVELEVRDTGVGMNAHTLERAFDPFFTTKRAGHAGGLGLTTCLGVIQRLRGYLAVESAPQQGTTFLIWLPPARQPLPS